MKRKSKPINYVSKRKSSGNLTSVLQELEFLQIREGIIKTEGGRSGLIRFYDRYGTDWKRKYIDGNKR